MYVLSCDVFKNLCLTLTHETNSSPIIKHTNLSFLLLLINNELPIKFLVGQGYLIYSIVFIYANLNLQKNKKCKLSQSV